MLKRLPDLTTSLVDNCLIHRPIKNQQDSIALQQHLFSLDNWASIWGMRFKVKKCNILRISRSQTPISGIYTRDGQPLDQVNEAKYLGITISNELDWCPHIDFITSKASYTLSFLRRNLRSSPQSLGELLQWRHNDRDGVSNHQPHYCLLNHLFRLSWKKTSKLRITGLCEGNSLGTGEFPAQRASNVENVSIWWCRHVAYILLVRSQSIMQQRHGGVSGWPHPEDRAHTAPGTVFLTTLWPWLKMLGTSRHHSIEASLHASVAILTHSLEDMNPFKAIIWERESQRQLA